MYADISIQRDAVKDLIEKELQAWRETTSSSLPARSDRRVCSWNSALRDTITRLRRIRRMLVSKTSWPNLLSAIAGGFWKMYHYIFGQAFPRITNRFIGSYETEFEHPQETEEVRSASHGRSFRTEASKISLNDSTRILTFTPLWCSLYSLQ